MENNSLIDDLLESDYEIEKIKMRTKSTLIIEVSDNKTRKNYIAKIIDKNNMSKTLTLNNGLPNEILIMQKTKRAKLKQCIKIKECFETNNLFVIIMEKAMCDLMDMILDGELKELVDKKSKFYEVVTAVKELHMKKIAHLDLKPENVFIREDGKALLGDFGSAYHWDKKKNMTQFVSGNCGTVFYCAPEVNKEHFDPFIADIWSIGILFYVLLTGTWPFVGNTFEEVHDNAKENNLHFHSSEMKKLDFHTTHLLKWMLSFNPADRPTIDEILNHPFLKEVNQTPSVDKKHIHLIEIVNSPSSSLRKKKMMLRLRTFNDHEKRQRKKSVDLRSYFDNNIINYINTNNVSASASMPNVNNCTISRNNVNDDKSNSTNSRSKTSRHNNSKDDNSSSEEISIIKIDDSKKPRKSKTKTKKLKPTDDNNHKSDNTLAPPSTKTKSFSRSLPDDIFLDTTTEHNNFDFFDELENNHDNSNNNNSDDNSDTKKKKKEVKENGCPRRHSTPISSDDNVVQIDEDIVSLENLNNNKITLVDTKSSIHNDSNNSLLSFIFDRSLSDLSTIMGEQCIPEEPPKQSNENNLKDVVSPRHKVIKSFFNRIKNYVN
eukprot:TRINITY_DN463_c0_g2_i1.p1 TRINITY_DN463_c0_g2~~TRINITY_DN463_c0_g2_i1.p1  ORF type:complete len:613 (-),score=157.10 TRINITY_DN463_c0_g2_i1:360-2168(-)